jgi:protochlorophyllide reductase
MLYPVNINGMSILRVVLLSALVSISQSFNIVIPGATWISTSSTSMMEASRRLNDAEGSTSPFSRRDLLNVTGKALTAAILGNVLSVNAATAEMPIVTKTILLTGGNSGIGFQAALRLANEGHTLVLPCRTLEKSMSAVKTLESLVAGAKLIPAECDLANLSSISAFAKALPSLIGTGTKLDTVCFNAGLARDAGAKEIIRTNDGFELTVGTNHLGHFFLHHQLLPVLHPSGRIVITASGVHDPESPGGAQGKTATLGNLEGLERDGASFEMVDGQPFNADKAYKDSKLCNVLFTRELQQKLRSSETYKNISVNCFNPGLIVSTGLFRDQNPFFTKIFDVAATDLLKVGETPEWGGTGLAYMTNVDSKGLYYSSAPGSSKYGDAAFGNQFHVVTPSIEARNDETAKRLWVLSEKLVGLQSA